MSPASPLRAMIVLASEQLWPNIHGIVHWHQGQADGGLSDLCIYYTEAKQSRQPAFRLRDLCRECYPELNLHLPPKPLGIQPEDVYTQIQVWKREMGPRRWVLNVTGGLKLMFAGGLDVVGEADTQVVYRELGDDWYELTRENGRVVSRPLAIPATETDRIPVEKLVKAHWEPSEHVTLSAERPAASLSVLDLVRAGLQQGWAWPQTFQAAGYPLDPGRPSSGKLFERFMAAVLQELGVTNLALNLELRSLAGQPLQEIDLVGNHGGRLVIVDCKLRTEEEEAAGRVEGVTSQIRQAASTQSRLGGLSARLVLLRPNRLFTDDERALAEAYRLTVLDADDAWNLFSRLAQWLAVPLPASLQAAEAEVLKSQAAGATRAFARENVVVRTLQAGSPNRGLLDLEATLGEYLRQTGRDWVAYWHGSVLCVRCGIPTGLSRGQLPKELDRLLGSFGKIDGLSMSHSGKSCRFLLSPRRQQRDALVRYLEGFLGRSLLTGPGATTTATSRPT